MKAQIIKLRRKMEVIRSLIKLLKKDIMSFYDVNMSLSSFMKDFAMTDLLDSKPTDEELRRALKDALDEINFTPAELLDWMSRRGDYRDRSASIRGIQRMMSGETRVSGTMMVLVNTLVRQHRRLKAQHSTLTWSINEHGTYATQIDGWHVYIIPQTRSRWLLSCSSGPSREDYSPPFGRWIDSLDEAKNKALTCVEEGMADLAEIEARI